MIGGHFCRAGTLAALDIHGSSADPCREDTERCHNTSYNSISHDRECSAGSLHKAHTCSVFVRGHTRMILGTGGIRVVSGRARKRSSPGKQHSLLSPARGRKFRSRCNVCRNTRGDDARTVEQLADRCRCTLRNCPFVADGDRMYEVVSERVSEVRKSNTDRQRDREHNTQERCFRNTLGAARAGRSPCPEKLALRAASVSTSTTTERLRLEHEPTSPQQREED